MKELIKSERLNKFKQNIKDEYDIDIYDLNIIGKNSYLLSDENNNYFLKETSFNTLEKLQFLYNQGVNNILYPFLNKEQLFVSKVENKNIYISKYLDNKIILEEYRVKNMYNELNFLHDQTSFKKQLNPRKSRGRFDELSNQLDYISTYSFKDCSQLENVIIPENVTTIGSNAFYGCSKLKELIVKNKKCQIDEKIIVDCHSLTKLEIPLINGIYPNYKYISVEERTPANYYTHPAFWWDENGNGIREEDVRR